MKCRWIIVTLVLALAVGGILATATGVIAFDHNPQGEYFDPSSGAWHRHAVLPLLGMAFAVPAAAVVALAAALYAVRRYVFNRWGP